MTPPPGTVDHLVAVLGAVGVGVVGVIETGGAPAFPAGRPTWVVAVRPAAPRAPGGPDVLADAARSVARRTSGPETVLAPDRDLRTPMSLGRRWWRVPARDAGTAGEPPVPLLDARHGTAAARWTLRHHGRSRYGDEPAALVCETGPTALRTEALGRARTLAEAYDDAGADGLAEHLAEHLDGPDLARVLVGLVHQAARGTVGDPAQARRTCGEVDEVLLCDLDALTPGTGDRTSDPAGLRRVLWETHRVVGGLAVRAAGP
ncbi:MAG: hypothetical protein CMH83_02245 [Nocardioides sp.]|nr:hypothetical protein [Nocardioides sp.]